MSKGEVTKGSVTPRDQPDSRESWTYGHYRSGPVESDVKRRGQTEQARDKRKSLHIKKLLSRHLTLVNRPQSKSLCLFELLIDDWVGCVQRILPQRWKVTSGVKSVERDESGTTVQTTTLSGKASAKETVWTGRRRSPCLGRLTPY